MQGKSEAIFTYLIYLYLLDTFQMLSSSFYCTAQNEPSCFFIFSLVFE